MDLWKASAFDDANGWWRGDDPRFLFHQQRVDHVARLYRFDGGRLLVDEAGLLILGFVVLRFQILICKTKIRKPVSWLPDFEFFLCVFSKRHC